MKNLGSDIDKTLHEDLLKSFITFIETFAPVYDKAEEYKMHISSENLIDDSEDNKSKLQTINEINSLLTSLVPHFIKFAQLENKLEKFYE